MSVQSVPQVHPEPQSSGPAPKPFPPDLNRWNWGAFLLNWIWGVGNGTYIALLTLVPVFGLVMPFVLGFKGSRWALRNGRWDSIEHFRRVQRNWAIWGVVVWIGLIALLGSIVGGTFYALEHSEAYELAVSRLQANPIASNVLGTPIATGFPFGSIKFNGASGTAALTFKATGPRAAGAVFVQAVKKDGVWSITRLILKLYGSDSAIDLINATNNNST